MSPTSRQTPPPEPFSYFSLNKGNGYIRSPLVLTVMALIWCLISLAILGYGALADLPTGGHVAVVFVGILWLLIGLGVLYMGVRRLRWKHTYEQITGHSPWPQ